MSDKIDYNKLVIDKATEIHNKLVEEVNILFPKEKDGRARWLYMGRVYNVIYGRFYGTNIGIGQKSTEEAVVEIEK